ncbi:MAG: hypothetical protein NUW23_08735 [Firmicutes bacterium]|nr:hypothetical protein [Bacillota bacterium]
MGIWIGAAGLLLTYFAALYLGKVRKRMKAGGARGHRQRRGPSAQEFMGIEDIQNGILILPGGRYRLILEVLGTLNFYLLTPEEQNTVEDLFRSCLASISFPIQFCVQTRKLDLSAQIEGLKRATRDQESPHLRQYRERFVNHLSTDWMRRRNVLTRRTYVVIPYDGPGGFEEAQQELWRRKELIEATLRRWLGTRVLSSEDIVEILYVLYNKERANTAKIEDAVEYGYLEPYVRGVSLRDVRELEEAS